MKEYYDLLLNYPDWFITVSPLEMKEFVEMNFRYFIDGKDKEGRPIYVCKIGKSGGKFRFEIIHKKVKFLM